MKFNKHFINIFTNVLFSVVSKGIRTIFGIMVNSEETILDFLVVIFYLLMFAFMYGVKFSLMSAFH